MDLAGSCLFGGESCPGFLEQREERVVQKIVVEQKVEGDQSGIANWLMRWAEFART